MILRWIYVTGNNKMYVALHVKCHIFWTDFNKIWSFLTDCHIKVPNNNFPQKSVKLEAAVIQADIEMYMAKLIRTFCKYTNVPKTDHFGMDSVMKKDKFFFKFIPVTSHLLLVCPYYTPSPVTSSLLKCLSEDLQGQCDTSAIALCISVWFIH